MTDNWVDEIAGRLPGVKMRRDISGAQLCTFAIGGDVQCLIEPAAPADVEETIRTLSEAAVPYRILGAGSNVVISSAGLRFPVIRLDRHFRWFKEVGEGIFSVGAAYGLMALSRELSNAGYSGLEFAGGIPASVGGAVRMNAGAHGGEIAQVVEEVTIACPRDGIFTLRSRELEFSYRHSSLAPDQLVLSVVLRLVPGDSTRIREARARHLSERKARQPLQLPSAGSVFRNPSPAVSAGRLIEEAGLKGAAIGGALISPQHGNWIVNPERKATDQDVWNLVAQAQSAVKERTGIDLRPEIIRWADEDSSHSGGAHIA